MNRPLLITALLCAPALAQAAGIVHYGDRLRVPLEGQIIAVDPVRWETPGERLLSRLLFSPLFELDEHGEPRPALAERAIPSEDFRDWRIQLHPFAADGNGRSIDTAVVIRSLERLAESDHGWPLWTLQTINAPDARTLVLRFSEPRRHLLHDLASPAAGIARRSPSGRVIGYTGAFVASQVSPGRRLELSASSFHPRGRPFLDRLQLSPTRPPLMVPASTAGTLDVALLRASEAPGIDLVQGRRTARLLHLLVHPRRMLLKQVEARMALSGLIDRKALVEVFMPAGGRPTTHIIAPEALPGGELRAALPFQPTLSTGAIARVRAQIGTSGRSDGDAELSLIYRRNAATHREIAERLQVELGRADLKARLQGLDDRSFYTRRNARSFDLCLDERIPDREYLDYAILGMLARVESKEEALVYAKRLFAAEGEGAAAATLWEIEDHLLRRALVIPLAFSGVVVQHKRDLRGLRVDGTGSLHLDGAWVVPVPRNERGGGPR